MAGIHKLTAAKVARLNETGRYGDGGGLWLQVSKWGTKAWIFRYMLNGRARAMGLGPLHTLTLAEAREKARRQRALLLEGIDPIAARQGQRQAAAAEQANAVPFAEAAEKFIAAHQAGWKSDKHAGQWRATLETYAYPVIGKLSVAAVETTHVLKILEPIWTVKTETASRVRGRVEAVLDWAKARHYRKGENPARWRGHLDKLLPSKTSVAPPQHFGAMPYDDLPAFMERLRDSDSISARALEFTILCAVRTGETTGARWEEIDLDKKVWHIPGARRKGRKGKEAPLDVPLSPRAIAILEGLPREDGNDHVFVGVRKSKGLSNMAMLEMLRGLTENGFTVHGFRSSFKDWATEQTNFAGEVSEAALGHVVSDKTEAAYRRGGILEKRRRLMAAWASYCEAPAPAGDVVPIRKEA